jgi:hypothetical protein
MTFGALRLMKLWEAPQTNLTYCLVNYGIYSPRLCMPRSGQTKEYKTGICSFSAKHAALRRESKELFSI